MAAIPRDALILGLEEAVNYFRQWSVHDRLLARHWIAKTQVTDFYVPASGGYVAGHGGPNRSIYRAIPVNGLVMHATFLEAWPNLADIGENRRIPLSRYEGAVARVAGARAGGQTSAATCPRCRLQSPASSAECGSCGFDLEQLRGMTIREYCHLREQLRAQASEQGGQPRR